MENETLEKKINRLDLDIEALGRVKKYLSNVQEINEHINILNEERQKYSDEIYLVDGKAYRECLDHMEELKNKELGKDEQIELLEFIKKAHNRKCPNISKKSYGLNAWLKHLQVECNWIVYEDRDWAGLVITRFMPRES